jgi:hypothetical protein
MNLYSITYDAGRPDQDQSRVRQYLERLHARRIHAPVWMLNSRATLWEIRDGLLDHLDKHDRLLIADVTHAPFAWHNMKTKSVTFRS